MKLLRAILFAGALVSVLAACNLFSVDITDPFGLDGETITATVNSAGGTPDGLRTQAASTASGSFSGSINDSSDARGTLTNTVTFEAAVVVQKAGGNTNAYPETITIENVNVAVSIDDGTDTVDDTGDITQDFTMTQNGPCASLASPCNYTMEVPAGVSISLAIGTILNNGASPNDVSATITLALDSVPGLEVGDTLQFTLEAAEGSGSL